MSQLLEKVLRERFHFAEFRKGQKEAIEYLLENGKLLSIQRAGHGKSLLYQLPSCLLDGMTLVISPLLALMRDQIMQLGSRFQIPSGQLNSDQTAEENRCTREVAAQGGLKILFISPEQLDHSERIHFFTALPLSLIVVDEAHCISTWGHDFRPSYRQIISFIKLIEEKRRDVKILGITATAPNRVEEDIKRQLFGDDRNVCTFREKMDRPHLQLVRVICHGIAEKLYLLEKLIEDEFSLIYCATRGNTELVAEYLRYKGIRAIAYHAGLDADLKKNIQEALLIDGYKAIVATNALGMGIDKSNLRLVIHFDVPGSITSYYQEVGRAGRDGLAAKAVLLYDSADLKIQEYFIESSEPKAADCDRVLGCLFPATLSTIKQEAGLHPILTTRLLASLVELGFCVKENIKGVQMYRKKHAK